ncbi:MAG: AAC(3) family N-acetyltransferase [Actinomycetota bacterium]|nr:AAC(3) family N-acetyltransferase [Actinomycetota bacterium]
MTSAGERARKVARGAPRPVREALRSARKQYRSARYRIRERFRPTTISRDEVASALRECGLTEGDTCFVQAAMSSFGGFESGPDTVLEALDDVLGSEGTLAMPAYSLTGPAIEHLAADPLFDPRTTPSRMGAISEGFRLMPGTLRSIHPTHSTCVRGPEAEEIVAGHETAATPFGDGTPFPRLVERDALQLFFGCGTGAITMYHSFECVRVPPFPLDVFADRGFDARCLDRQGHQVTVRTLVHNPDLHPGRIDSNPRLQNVYRGAILEAGGRAVLLGHGEIIAIRLPVLFEVFERLVQQGVTIYDAEVPEEPPAVPPQDRVDA